MAAKMDIFVLAFFINKQKYLKCLNFSFRCQTKYNSREFRHVELRSSARIDRVVEWYNNYAYFYHFVKYKKEKYSTMLFLRALHKIVFPVSWVCSKRESRSP